MLTDILLILMLLSLFVYQLFQITFLQQDYYDFQIQQYLDPKHRYLRLSEYIYGFRNHLGMLEIESNEMVDIRYMLQLLYPKAYSGIFYYISAQQLPLDQSLRKEIYALNWDFLELYSTSFEQALAQLICLLKNSNVNDEQTILLDCRALLFQEEIDQGLWKKIQLKRLQYRKRKLLSHLKPLLKKNTQVILLELSGQYRNDKALIYPILSRILLKSDDHKMQCELYSHFHPHYQKLNIY